MALINVDIHMSLNRHNYEDALIPIFILSGIFITVIEVFIVCFLLHALWVMYWCLNRISEVSGIFIFTFTEHFLRGHPW